MSDNPIDDKTMAAIQRRAQELAGQAPPLTAQHVLMLRAVLANRTDGDAGMTTFRCLFDNPVFGDHSPLVLGWGEDQLWPIVDRLAPFMPDNLTVGMKLAIAGVARSIVTEEKITGNGVHFARGKDAYRIPKRYRDGDPRNTWHYITRAMDTLQSVGLIQQAPGVWCPNSRGYQSVAWATGDLVALVGPLLDVSEHRRLNPAGGDDRPPQPARQGGRRLRGDRRHHSHARAGGSGEREPLPSRSTPVREADRDSHRAPNLQWLLRTWGPFLLPRCLVSEHARPSPSRPGVP